MIQVRTSVFETNSSMTHSIVMCPTASYEKWTNGEAMFNEWKKPKFVDAEEARKLNGAIMRKWYDATIVRKDENDDDYQYFENEDETLENLTLENIEKYENGEFKLEDFYFDRYEVSENFYYDYEFWYEEMCMYYETFEDEYEDGDVKVTAFGYYGHD